MNSYGPMTQCVKCLRPMLEVAGFEKCFTCHYGKKNDCETPKQYRKRVQEQIDLEWTVRLDGGKWGRVTDGRDVEEIEL